MKKTKNAKKQKQKTVPFTCVIKGDGINLDIKLSNTPNFAGFFETLRERLAEPEYDVEDVTPEDLKAGSAMFVTRLPSDELEILVEEAKIELDRRAQTNGTTTTETPSVPTASA